MTTVILTVMDFVIIVCLVAGWYFKPMLLRDAMDWCRRTKVNLVAYFKK